MKSVYHISQKYEGLQTSSTLRLQTWKRSCVYLCARGRVSVYACLIAGCGPYTLEKKRWRGHALLLNVSTYVCLKKERLGGGRKGWVVGWGKAGEVRKQEERR